MLALVAVAAAGRGRWYLSRTEEEEKVSLGSLARIARVWRRERERWERDGREEGRKERGHGEVVSGM